MVSPKTFTEIQKLLDNESEMRQFGNIAKLYPFTTENISGYLDGIDIEDKNVISVTGSGDHILNLVCLGATKVTGFDVNSLSHHMTNLKLTAMQVLEYEAFLGYFVNDSKSVYNYKTYTQIRSHLRPETRMIFDYIYLQSDYDGRKLRNSHLFYQHPNVDVYACTYNRYIRNKKSYHKMKSRRSEFHWHHTSIRELEATLPIDEKYDLVLLSNVMDYAKQIFRIKQSDEMFIRECIKPLFDRLNVNGIVVAQCIFAVESNHASSGLRDGKLWRDVLDTERLEYIEYLHDSVIPGEEDVAIMLKKTR